MPRIFFFLLTRQIIEQVGTQGIQGEQGLAHPAEWLQDSRAGLELLSWYFYESTESARIERPSPRAKSVSMLKKVWLLYQDDAPARVAHAILCGL